MLHAFAQLGTFWFSTINDLLTSCYDYSCLLLYPNLLSSQYQKIKAPHCDMLLRSILLTREPGARHKSDIKFAFCASFLGSVYMCVFFHLTSLYSVFLFFQFMMSSVCSYYRSGPQSTFSSTWHQLHCKAPSDDVTWSISDGSREIFFYHAEGQRDIY